MEIFSKFKLLEEKSEERALVYLYESIIELSTEEIEKFLESVDKSLLTSDSIVHILNAISPKKNEIKNLSSFVDMCKEKLIELEGEKVAEDLMKVL